MPVVGECDNTSVFDGKDQIVGYGHKKSSVIWLLVVLGNTPQSSHGGPNKEKK
nr:MAG TPA: hypothetical protein [Caudoviricetes sp.]